MADIQVLREDLRTRKAALLQSLQAGGGSTRGIRRLLQSLSGLADQTLQALWAQAAFPDGFALVAVGGFGRGELFPHSDVDVLLLMPDGVSPDADDALKRRVEEFIGNCWDCGLEIGSSVRTLADCVAEAEKDVTVQTSLLESRLVAGNRRLYTQFTKRFNAVMDPRALVELADGKVLVVGPFDRFNGMAVPGMVRIQPTGQIDATFIPDLPIPPPHWPRKTG